MLTLPGFFRPTKLWDMLVMYQGQLVAALEFKSQVAPSFGKQLQQQVRGSYRYRSRSLDRLP